METLSLVVFAGSFFIIEFSYAYWCLWNGKVYAKEFDGVINTMEALMASLVGFMIAVLIYLLLNKFSTLAILNNCFSVALYSFALFYFFMKGMTRKSQV